MKIEVTKEDIKKIDYACYNEGGFLAIMCDGDTCNIEETLLRSILKCFGDEYKVIKAEDYNGKMIRRSSIRNSVCHKLTV